MDMDQADLPELARGLFDSLLNTPLLLAAVVAVAVGFLGSLVARRSRALGGLLRTVSSLGLFAVLILTVIQVTRLNPGANISVPGLGLPEQTVAGEETRVPLARDGHFWLEADINGASARFLVDTGATLTAVAPAVAQAARLEPRRGGVPVMLRTANGTVAAQAATVDELRLGNIVARDLDAIIAPGLGETNVIGMNFLSRLKSWRVEGQTLILVPNHPQPVEG